MLYWCTGCRSYFSVKTGTPPENSNIPPQKWTIGIYLRLFSLKSVSGTGLGTVGKTVVVGAKDRATNQVSAWVVTSIDKPTLQGFVGDVAGPDATVYTDEAAAYEGVPFAHEAVKHLVAEYVRAQAHTNGVESFWDVFKRARTGTFHKMSSKHPNHYVQEFAGKHNIRESKTLDQMCSVAFSLTGRTLPCRWPIADDGLSSGARS